MILKLNLHSPRQNLLNLSHSVTLNEVFPQLCTSSIIFFIFLEPERVGKRCGSCEAESCTDFSSLSS